MVLRVMLGEAYQKEVALCSTNPSLYELSLNLCTRRREKPQHHLQVTKKCTQLHLGDRVIRRFKLG